MSPALELSLAPAQLCQIAMLLPTSCRCKKRGLKAFGKGDPIRQITFDPPQQFGHQLRTNPQLKSFHCEENARNPQLVIGILGVEDMF